MRIFEGERHMRIVRKVYASDVALVLVDENAPFICEPYEADDAEVIISVRREDSVKLDNVLALLQPENDPR